MCQPSTRCLTALLAVDTLRNLCQSLAALNAIICRDWEYRYYSYNQAWSDSEACFSMRNGSGDYFFILFNQAGAIIYGLAHESMMSPWRHQPPTHWPDVLNDVPDEFKSFIDGEPAKSLGATFCLWRRYPDTQWRSGNVTFPDDEYGDGSKDMLFIFDNDPATYCDWAINYYEDQFDGNLADLPVSLVTNIYQHVPISRELTLAVNPTVGDFAELRGDLDEIGYKHTL